MENTYQGKIAAVYARFSSHSQTEQSIEGQLADAYEFAKRNGITIIKEYIDRAISGRTDDRPDFLRMIEDSAKREFSIVLVWKLDRFSRDLYNSVIYRKTLSDNGVTVVSVTEPISDDPMGRMLTGILESWNEYYSAELAVKIRRGIRESVKKGWFPGGPIPFGYLHQNHKLIPDERTVPIVREIYQRYISGEQIKSIVRDLDKRGIRSRTGRPISFPGIVSILKNPTYIGDYYHGGNLVPGCAVPVIDKKTFYMAADVREKHRRAPAASRKPDVQFLLSGKLFCGECGKHMRGDSGTSKNGDQYHYYTCIGKKLKKNDCRSRSIPKNDIEYAVCKIISDYVLNKKRRTMEIMADYIISALDQENGYSETDALEARLKQLERDMNKLIDSLMEMPESVRPMIAQRMEDVESQRRETTEKLARTRLEEAARCTREDIITFFKTNILSIDTEQNRRMIIDKFLNCAYVYDDGRLVIYLNHFKGMPYPYQDKNDPPGKDSHKEGKPLTKGRLPKEISGLPAFKSPPDKSSSLYSYAPPYADKDEPQLPHLFFLHGRMGMVVWRQDLR